jgi:hypothetical protein
MKEVILDYLKKQSKVDAGLQSNFIGNEDKIDGCISYIQECARKELKSTSGFIQDEVVFKWARDYFNDKLYTKDKTKKVEKTPEDETETSIDETKTEKQKSVTKKAIVEKTSTKKEKLDNKDDLLQLNLFDFGE